LENDKFYVQDSSCYVYTGRGSIYWKICRCHFKRKFEKLKKENEENNSRELQVVSGVCRPSVGDPGLSIRIVTYFTNNTPYFLFDR
jgi:hypothetical protein